VIEPGQEDENVAAGERSPTELRYAASTLMPMLN
jgi:hypothetical protein